VIKGNFLVNFPDSTSASSGYQIVLPQALMLASPAMNPEFKGLHRPRYRVSVFAFLHFITVHTLYLSKP